jgi:hypothetical protein
VFFLHQGTKYRELFRIAYAFYDKKYLGFALIFMGNMRVNFGANLEGVLAVGS